MSESVGRNDPCPCESGRKYKKCCLDAERSAGPAAPPTPVGEDWITLLIDSPDGVMARRIPPASTLPGGADQGYAAEVATQDAAAMWGLPDFVYRADPLRVGSGVRELGDGIVIVGGLGIVVQVKSREAPSSDAAKERRWLDKKATQALAQGSGTVRRLGDAPRVLTNLRGRSVTVRGADKRWVVAVVIDHPDPPENVVPELSGAHPAVVLLRRDWEFLFEQLKSTHAVCAYLERVAGDAVALGSEPLRYYELAQADREAEPEVLAPEILGPGRVVSTPLLPLVPAATEDRMAHRMFRLVLEDIAATQLRRSKEEDRLAILAEVDRLPVAQRAEIGRFMLDAMRIVRREAAKGGIAWHLRTVRGNVGAAHLGFGACSEPHTDDLQAAFSAWAQLRHHDLLQVSGDVDGLTTVGVLLTPRRDGRRAWDTTMVSVSGEVGFDADDLALLREAFPGEQRAAA